jgi:hypothetical protein
MYDARVGRFLSIDPKYKKFPAFSNYSYAANSPILFIDQYGEDPKVAILFYQGNEPAFETHKAALEKAGFKVVRAQTGQELLKILGDYSSPESPIKNLILISHGSPGGLSTPPGTRAGFYTNSELLEVAKTHWKMSRQKEIKNEKGIITDKNDPNYDIAADVDAETQASLESDEFWSDKSESNLTNQLAYIDKFKNETGAITIGDFVKAINNQQIHFEDLWTTVFAGCNMAGTYNLDGQEIFSQTYSIETKSTSFASQGFTGPIWGTSLRISNKVKGIKDGLGKWIKTDPDGKRHKGKNTLDMANPK